MYGPKRLPLLIIFGFVAAPMVNIGCARVYLDPGLVVCKTGDKAAYIHDVENSIPVGPEGKVLGGSVSVLWFDVSNPSAVHSVPIGSVKGGYATGLAMRLAFNPRGNLILVQGNSSLRVIDTATEKVIILYDVENIDSAIWIDDDTVGYVSGPYLSRQSLARYFTVCTQKISTGQRTTLLSQDFIKYSSWSPDGRFVAFVGKSNRLSVVNVNKGTVQICGGPIIDEDTSLQWSWNPIASKALCVGEKTVMEHDTLLEHKTYTAFTVDAESSQCDEIPQDFVVALGPEVTMVESLWTPDGKYVVFRNGLVDASTWKWIPAPQLLSADMKPRWAINVHRAPVSGWLRVKVTSAPQAGNFPPNYEGRFPAYEEYIADYQGHLVSNQKIPSISVMTPDGSRFVGFDTLSGKLFVQKIELTSPRDRAGESRQ